MTLPLKKISDRVWDLQYRGHRIMEVTKGNEMCDFISKKFSNVKFEEGPRYKREDPDDDGSKDSVRITFESDADESNFIFYISSGVFD